MSSLPSLTVLLFHLQATALVTRASLASCVVTERSDDEMSSLLFLEAFGEEHACGSEPDVAGIRRDANALLEKVDALIGGGGLGEGRLRDGEFFVPSRRIFPFPFLRTRADFPLFYRITCPGNNAYLNAVKILVLRNVFKSSRSDTRVQKSSLNVLEACSASVAAYRPLQFVLSLFISCFYLFETSI